MAVHNGKLYSGSENGKIKEWDLDTALCQRTLKEQHIDRVHAIIDNLGHIYSCSTDKTIRQWGIANGKCLQTLYGHTGQVNDIALANNKLYSASSDETIKIWDLRTNKCQLNLECGHPVKSIKIYNGKLFSGHSDGRIIVWKAATPSRKLHEHTASVNSIAAQDNLLFSGSGDGSIIKWDFDTVVPTQFVDCEGSVNSIDILGDTLYSSSASTICQWDLKTGECLQRLKLQEDQHNIHKIILA